jgi:transcription initiation factor TFIIB
MQEIEKLKVLQSEREALKSCSKQKEQEKNAENQTETACPECGSRQLVHDYERAELVCQSCGLVIDDDIIDRGPEWRAFDPDQWMKRSRVGAPMTLTIHDKGLSTMIDWRNRDSYGKAISYKNRAQLYRLRKWQRRIRVSNATERKTLRSHSRNWTAWPPHWACRGICVRPQLWSTVTRSTRT